MKFIMNGGIVIGTLDGANVEISEQVQRDNVFIFGLKSEQIDTARHSMKCAPTLSPPSSPRPPPPSASWRVSILFTENFRYTGVLIEKSFRAALRDIEAGTFGPRVVCVAAFKPRVQLLAFQVNTTRCDLTRA